MQGLKQPYYSYAQPLSSDSSAGSDEDVEPNTPPQVLIPDLFSYFGEFPDVSVERRIRIARTYASAIAAQAGLGGRRKRARQAGPERSTPPTVPEENPSE